MNRTYDTIRLRLWMVFLCLLPCFGASAQVTTKQLHLLHTNDTHSCIEPVSIDNEDTLQAGKGGFVRRATCIKQLRREHPDLLLFDTGDFSQGSPYYTIYKGEVEIRLMNKMGYDAATIGNHEFDYGLENMARLFRMASFPIVCANYDVAGTPLEGLVKPYVVLKRNGLRIGVFGLSPQLEGLVQRKCYEGVTYQEPISCANRVATLLKEQEACDVVICLSHLGWQTSPGDEELIASTRHIDVVLGGHTHSYFESPLFYKNLDGKEVPMQQMGKNGCYIGYLLLELVRK